MLRIIVFLILFLLSAVALTVGICMWVYKDAKEHGDRGWLWVLIILISSPLMGGLIYLIARRDDRKPCRFCGWIVDKDANYCEHCGKQYPVCEPGSGYLEDLPAENGKMSKRNKKFLAAVIASIVVLVVSLVGVILGAVGELHLDEDSDWNSDWVMMNVENTGDNVWTFRYNKASENYHTSARLTVEDAQNQQLAVDLSFAKGESMRVKILQETQNGLQQEKEYFLSSDSQTQYIPLNEFTEGKIKVLFYNNGVEDVNARVTVAPLAE